MGSTLGTSTARVIAVALVAVLGLVVAAPSASAAKNSKYCKAVKNLSSDTPSKSGADEATTLGKSFHKAANSAPSDIKSAMNTVGDYYEAIGEAGSNPAKVAVALQDIGAYTKAVAKWSKYTIKTCSTVAG